MVPPYSHGISRVPWYSGYALHTLAFAYRTFTVCGGFFQTLRLASIYVMHVLTPKILLLLVWPLPRSLATTCGISVDFSSSPYLDVSVQAVPLPYLLIQYGMTGLNQPDCSIRKSTDRCLFTTPRSISLLTASFFGSWCQGIPLALFVA